MTGRRPPCSSPVGRQTFTVKQSSLIDVAPYGGFSTCGQAGPSVLASNTPDIAAFGTGGWKRFAPAVLSANGMPRNASTFWSRSSTGSTTPHTLPLVVSTTPVAQPESEESEQATSPAASVATATET